MDELLQQALYRREQLRAELKTLEDFIQSYSKVQERRTSKGGQGDLFAPAKRQSFRVRRAQENAEAMADAEKLILEARRPLTRTELLKGLEGLGHKIEGRDKSKVLGTNLWRSKRFHNLSGLGYWPMSTPLPEAYKSARLRPSMLLEEDD